MKSSKKLSVLLSSIFLFCILACSPSKEEKAFKVFNEGVAFSLEAGQLMQAGQEEAAKEKHLLAIKKFKETLTIDETHQGVASALGHSYYETQGYDEAISWFGKAIEIQPDFAVNYQYLGLSQVNKGRIPEGEKNMNKAFELDPSQELRDNTIQQLVYTGNLAYAYADAYAQEGEEAKGNDYRKFVTRVLITALEYSDNDKEIGQLLLDYAAEMKDEDLSNFVKAKMTNK